MANALHNIAEMVRILSDFSRRELGEEPNDITDAIDLLKGLEAERELLASKWKEACDKWEECLNEIDRLRAENAKLRSDLDLAIAKRDAADNVSRTAQRLVQAMEAKLVDVEKVRDEWCHEYTIARDKLDTKTSVLERIKRGATDVLLAASLNDEPIARGVLKLILNDADATLDL